MRLPSQIPAVLILFQERWQTPAVLHDALPDRWDQIRQNAKQRTRYCTSWQDWSESQEKHSRESETSEGDQPACIVFTMSVFSRAIYTYTWSFKSMPTQDSEAEHEGKVARHQIWKDGKGEEDKRYGCGACRAFHCYSPFVDCNATRWQWWRSRMGRRYLVYIYMQALPKLDLMDLARAEKPGGGSVQKVSDTLVPPARMVGMTRTNKLPHIKIVTCTYCTCNTVDTRSGYTLG